MCVCTDPEETVEASDVSTELRQVRHETETFLVREQIHQTAGVHTWRQDRGHSDVISPEEMITTALYRCGESTPCVCVCVCVTWLKLDLQFAHRVVVSKETQLSVEGVQSDSSFQTGERLT